MAGGLKLKAKRRDGWCVLTVQGEFEHAHADLVYRRAAVLLGYGCPVLIDLTYVSFLDAGAVSCLSDILLLYEAARLELAICPPAGRARRVLDVVKADEFLPLRDSADEVCSPQALGAEAA